MKLITLLVEQKLELEAKLAAKDCIDNEFLDLVGEIDNITDIINKL